MMYPLVQDLAAKGFPVRLTCGVLKFSPQAFYKWAANPICERDWDDAHLTNAIVDIHGDDPEFGYRFISDELEAAGHEVGEGRVHRLCREHKIWSTTTKKGRRSSGKIPGPAVHDDLVKRNFSAPAPDVTWLTDITEHPTAEGKLYACCIKDVFSNRIVGYALSDRMTADLAVGALRSAVARRQPRGTVVVHSDRGGQFRSRKFRAVLKANDLTGQWGGSPQPETTRRWNRSMHCCKRTSSTDAAGERATSSPTRSPTGSSTRTIAADANAVSDA